MNKKFIIILPICFFVIFWILFFVFLFQGAYDFFYEKNHFLIESNLKKCKNVKINKIYWTNESSISAILIIDNKHKIELKYLTLSQFNKTECIQISKVDRWGLYEIFYNKNSKDAKIEVWPSLNIVTSAIFINKRIDNIYNLFDNFEYVYNFIEKIPNFEIDDSKIKELQYWDKIPAKFYYKDEEYEYKIIKELINNSDG